MSAERLSLIGTALTASEGVVVNDELALTPDYRPGALLETVPGLTVTVHSGEGKANQYLLRGYNLDHGTDLGVWVDDMPINEPTHAHGEGYADLNFMIPELATDVTYTKGTYYAAQGDFSSVGSVHTAYRNTVDDTLEVSAGTLGFERVLGMGSTALSEGNLLGAVELQHYAGPWANPDDQRKVNLVLRYSEGTNEDGFSVTGMFYHDLWNATTDQPVRAMTEGLIGRFGSLDPTDGGYAQRASLSGIYHAELAGGQFTGSVYVISNHLTLWNDFTHYLVDPINGDQEAQHEDRTTLGSDLAYLHAAKLGDIRNDVEVGFHSRYDFNDVYRLPSQDRVLLTAAQLAAVNYPAFFSENDTVRLSSVAAYVQDTSYWLSWLRTVLGFREDYMYGNDVGTNYGTATSQLPEPKANLIITPLETTELYLSWGRGFHSDDLRGVNQAHIEGIPGAPLIAAQTGEELGVRQQFQQNVALTFALYNLDAQSETTYNPDIGQDFAGPASRRYGAELNLTYQPLKWLEMYGSYSINHARYDTPYDDGTGHVGYYLPNAPFAAGSLNIYLKNLGRWYGGLELRYLGGYPLSADDEVQGQGYHEWNGDIHYQLSESWTLGLGIYNILNTRANAMEYWYIDRLPGEPAAGAADVHIHPLEPISARFTVQKTF